jgi:DNA-binding NarL/FixJ family response regulator
MTFYKKRCVIINSDEKFIAVCASLIELSERFLCINFYTSCEDALQNLKRDLPDIVIMDVDYPQMKGPQIIERIKDFNAAIEIMIITDYEDDELVFNALSAGANGYILKTSFMPLLIDSLSSIAKGQSPVSPSITRKLITSIQVNRTSPLTSRETEILKLITHGKSYSIIAAELGISEFTSRTHIKNIYRKLKVNSKSQAVKKALTEKLVSIHMVN